MRMAVAVIFDMDGVLVDTEPVINAAAIRGLAEFGVQARPEDFIPFIGAGEARYIGGVAELYGVAYRSEMKDRVYEIYLEIVGQMLRPQPGALECLKRLTQLGVSLALASSADRIKIEANLRVAGIPLETFAVILSAEDVTHKKPDPEIYLRAAERLGIDPGQCVVVEDALNGIAAANRAGMRCIAVETTFAREKLQQQRPEAIATDMTAVCAMILKWQEQGDDESIIRCRSRS